MRIGFLALAVLLLALLAAPARADLDTAFVGGTKVGDVQTAHAWVVATNAEQTAYGVLVASDTHQYFLLTAEADKGVVDPASLGRFTMVKAKVLTRHDENTVHLQILAVTPIKPETPKDKTTETPKAK